jgi:hypothetical protein
MICTFIPNFVYCMVCTKELAWREISALKAQASKLTQHCLQIFCDVIDVHNIINKNKISEVKNSYNKQ